MPILDPAPKQTSPQKALSIVQHWKPEITAIRALGRGSKSSKNCKIIFKKRLGRHLYSIALRIPTLYT